MSETQHSDLQREIQIIREKARLFDAILNDFEGIMYRCGYEDNRVMNFISDQVEVLTGYLPADYIENRTVSYDDLIHPDDRNYVADAIRSACDKGSPYSLSYRLMASDGKEKWVKDNGHVITDTQKKTVTLEGVIFDISEIKQTDRNLQHREHRLTEIISATPIAGFILDINHCVTVWTPACEALTGIPAPEIVGTNDQWRAFYSTQRPVLADLLIDKKFESEKKHYYGDRVKKHPLIECAYQGEDFFPAIGENGRWLFFTASPLHDSEGNIEGAVETLQDITERKLAEQERIRLVSAIEQAAEIIMITDIHGTIEYVNSAFERITGYRNAEVIGENPRILKSGKHDKNFYEKMWQTLLGGKTWRGRLVNRKKDGSFYTEEAVVSPAFDDAGNIVNFVAAKRDITELLKLEEQYYQSQKMESIGRLAGGVAHDFNNLLTVIVGNSELAMMNLDPENELYKDITEIKETAERATQITRQLLAFSRKQTKSPKVLNLNDVIKAQQKMLERLVGENIQFEYVLADNLWNIEADPHQLVQIIMNFAVNARDAIDGTGTITIETKNASLDETYRDGHIYAAPGDYILFVFSDSGSGMDAETQNKIFEPFFTTKEKGKGTGLGLSTVFGIVKQSNGIINVYSEPEMGTSFKVFLPRYYGDQTEKSIETAGKPIKGNETVMIVEDESQILMLAGRVLKKYGYAVIPCDSPEDAVEKARQHEGHIDLLLTDVVMPAMNGKELQTRIETINPAIKTIFMSGYTENVIAHHGVIDKGIDFIQKPFNMNSLAQKVREVLDRQ